MADLIQTIFKKKKVNLSKLADFGFEQTDFGFCYRKILPESGFGMTVRITCSGDVSAEVIDPSLNEPYTLHLADGAVGSFVGRIRGQYEETLAEIAERCFEPDVFQSGQARELIAYVRDTYGDELEFLWRKLSDNAVWRRKDTGKWYAVLMVVPRRRLGMDSDEPAEVIDFRMPPEELADLVDNERYFPGYHMNKRHWCTVVLDGSVEFEELCRRLGQSYGMAE